MRLYSFAVACLASGALAQPAPDTPVDACCCCDPSRNVIGCTRSIPKADCFCAAVVCPPSAKTVWDDKLQSRTACTGTATSVPVQASGRHGSVLTVKLPIQRETMIVVDPHPQATASSNKRDFRNKAENNGEPVVVQHEPLYSRPTIPASSMLLERIAVEKSPRTTQAHGRHSCCCCDIVTEQVVCHVSDEECMCADVMCPENAKTVFATAVPTHTRI
ncbi:hypothetical protein E4U10_004083 [Claviceps purpurea]|nr:hypothetical protein E4U10_004083 [Claviceps purpurea]